MSDDQAGEEPKEVSPEEYRQMVATGQVNSVHKTPIYLRRGMGLPALAGAVICASLIIGFFGGITYERGKASVTPASTTASAGGSNAQNGFGGRSGFRRSGAIGQVTAVSDSSITVNNQRTGKDQTFTITSSTTVTNNGAPASVSDIQTGDTVVVRTSSSDPSTAASILINPSFGGGTGGFGGPSQTDQPSNNSNSI